MRPRTTGPTHITGCYAVTCAAAFSHPREDNMKIPGYFDCGVAPFPSEPTAPQAQAKPSRWARASREKLEDLADLVIDMPWSGGPPELVAELRASCPPLRTEAEVAAEALQTLRACICSGPAADVFDPSDAAVARLRALAKEPTR